MAVVVAQRVFPMSLTLGLLGFLGQRQHLVPDSGLRGLLCGTYSSDGWRTPRFPSMS